MDQAEVIQNMVTGKAAHIMMVIAAWSQMDDPTKSAVVDKVEFARGTSCARPDHGARPRPWLGGVAKNVPDDRKRATVEFLRWYQTKAAQMATARAGGIPVSAAIYREPIAEERKYRWMKAIATSLPHAVSTLNFPEAGEVIPILELGLNQAIAGETKPAAALNGMADQIHAVVASTATTPASCPTSTEPAGGSNALSRWGTFGPALLLMLALGLLPLANLVYTSFFTVTWSGGQPTFKPAGFTHYLALPADPLLRAGFRNTIVFAVFAVGGQMLLGFALALLCSRVRRGRVLYRALFILPILIPGIVIGAIWKLMLNFDFGLVNQAIELLGFEPRNWLGDGATALALGDRRRHLALDAVLLPAAAGRPRIAAAGSLRGGQDRRRHLVAGTALHHPAADGARHRRDLRLPSGDRLQGVRRVYLLTAGGPVTATQVLSFTLYQRFFTEDRAGYGSAMAVAIIFFCSLLLVLALSVRRRSERAAMTPAHSRIASRFAVQAALIIVGAIVLVPVVWVSSAGFAPRSRCSPASSCSRPSCRTSQKSCSPRPRNIWSTTATR
jgi:multiple sugar transport system permease protein